MRWKALTSGGARIVVNEAVKPLPADDWTAIQHELRIGWAQGQRPVRAGPVVMLEVLVQDLDQMALAHDDQPVQALAADGAKQPLADCVGRGSAEWRSHDLEA